jgi:hypothetical protein
VVFQSLVTFSAQGALPERGAKLGEELIQPFHGLHGMIFHTLLQGLGTCTVNTQGALVIPRWLMVIAAEVKQFATLGFIQSQGTKLSIPENLSMPVSHTFCHYLGLFSFSFTQTFMGL